MHDKFRLIQRGEFNNNLDTINSFLGGHPGCLINLDYMGSAEFEWGAIPKAYRRIMGQFDKYSLHITDILTNKGVPFCLYCRDGRYEKVLSAIKKYLDEHYQMKSWTNMHAHFEPFPIDEWLKIHHKYRLKTNFWWCIDKADLDTDGSGEYDNIIGDWIAFIGGIDRQKAFIRVINRDYSTWWMTKPEDERKKEYEEAFR